MLFNDQDQSWIDFLISNQEKQLWIAGWFLNTNWYSFFFSWNHISLSLYRCALKTKFVKTIVVQYINTINQSIHTPFKDVFMFFREINLLKSAKLLCLYSRAIYQQCKKREILSQRNFFSWNQLFKASANSEQGCPENLMENLHD